MISDSLRNDRIGTGDNFPQYKEQHPCLGTWENFLFSKMYLNQTFYLKSRYFKLILNKTSEKETAGTLRIQWGKKALRNKHSLNKMSNNLSKWMGECMPQRKSSCKGTNIAKINKRGSCEEPQSHTSWSDMTEKNI